MSPELPPLTERRSLVLCGICSGLSGPAPGAPHGTEFRDGLNRYVECVCEEALSWEEDHRHPDRGPETNRADVERGGYPEPRPFLCLTCAAVLRFDRTRWTVYHCEDCAGRIVRLNSGAGRLVVPLGKHSIVNGASIRRELTQEPEEVVDLLERTGAGVTQLRKWVRRRTADNLVRVGLPTDRDVPAERYCEAIGAAGRREEEAFYEMLRFVAWEDEEARADGR